MTAYVGMPVIYVPRPGRRETEIAALVTAFYPGDLCDLVLFPPMAESYQQPKVPMLSEKFTNHVWKIPDAMRVPLMASLDNLTDAELSELKMLTEPGHIMPSGMTLETFIQALGERVAVLEAKRGPGRPPNPVKAAERENA